MTKFDINMPLSSELCEIIGLFIGDGFTNIYGSHYTIQFTGNMKEEEYYQKKIIPNIEKLFGLKPYIKREFQNNAIRVNYSSKLLFQMLTERFGTKAGKKSKTVLIPEEILNSKNKFLLSTIMGIYDAEGYIYLDSRKIYKKPYPRIELRMQNPKLLKQIHKILTENDIKSFFRDEITLVVNGIKDVKKFNDKIGFSNKKHLDKLKNL